MEKLLKLDNNVIVNNISVINQRRNFAIHSLAFGNNADFKLVQRISSRNKGLARKIYEDSDAELQLTGLILGRCKIHLPRYFYCFFKHSLTKFLLPSYRKSTSNI